MDHQFLFIPTQALESLTLEHHPDHLHQADLFRHQIRNGNDLDLALNLVTEKACLDHALNPILRNLQRKMQEIVHNRHTLIILSNQARDPEVLLDPVPGRVLAQHQGITRAPDLDQIQ